MLMLQAISFLFREALRWALGFALRLQPRDASLPVAAEKHALTIIDGKVGKGK